MLDWGLRLVAVLSALVADPVFADPIISDLKAATYRIIIRDAIATQNIGGTGSGVAISEDGLVVTNWHVINRDKSLFSVLQEGGGEEIRAVVVASDEGRDLAILQLDQQSSTVKGGLPFITISSRTIQDGNATWAIGYPGDADVVSSTPGNSNRLALGATVTKGVLSRQYEGSWNGGPQISILQHTADINPGNSGGGLFNDCGDLIGINTAKPRATIVRGQTGAVEDVISGSGIYFASSAATLLAFLSESSLSVEAVDTQCITDDASVWDDAPLRTLLIVLGLGVVVALMLSARPRQVVIAGASRLIGRPIGGQKVQTAGSYEVLISAILSSGHDVSKRFDLSEGNQIVIGRHPALSEFIVDDEQASMRHLRITVGTDGVLHIEDLNSLNGSKYAGNTLEPCKSHSILSGTEIEIGGTKIIPSSRRAT